MNKSIITVLSMKIMLFRKVTAYTSRNHGNNYVTVG